MPGESSMTPTFGEWASWSSQHTCALTAATALHSSYWETRGNDKRTNGFGRNAVNPSWWDMFYYYLQTIRLTLTLTRNRRKGPGWILYRQSPNRYRPSVLPLNLIAQYCRPTVTEVHSHWVTESQSYRIHSHWGLKEIPGVAIIITIIITIIIIIIIIIIIVIIIIIILKDFPHVIPQTTRPDNHPSSTYQSLVRAKPEGGMSYNVERRGGEGGGQIFKLELCFRSESRFSLVHYFQTHLVQRPLRGMNTPFVQHFLGTKIPYYRWGTRALKTFIGRQYINHWTPPEPLRDRSPFMIIPCHRIPLRITIILECHRR